MNVSDYLKSGFQLFHKNQGTDFGNSLKTNIKSNKLKEQRQNTRSKLMLQKRLINEKTMSPYKTPKVADKPIIKPSKELMKRLEMLKKWKEEKAKKLQEEHRKNKPLFKVTHAPTNIGGTKLENVNKLIKGKPIKLQANVKKQKSPLATKYNFAPKNYQFKGPSNIKAINGKESDNRDKKPRITRQNNVCESPVLVLNKGKKVMINQENEPITPKKVPRVYKKTPAKINNGRILNDASNKINMQVNENQRSNTRMYQLRSRNVHISTTDKPTKRTLIENARSPVKKLRNDKEATNANKQIRIIETIRSPNRIRKLKHDKEGTNAEAAKHAINTKSDFIENNVNIKRNNSDHSISDLSMDYPIGEFVDSSQNNSWHNTPKQNGKSPTSNSHNKSLTYISPFVTISRGKNSARKEYHSRKSRGGIFDSSPDVKNSTGPQAGAAYFHRVLDQEISRMQSLCDEWNLYKEKRNPAEEVCDMINVATGQAQLLMQKKFKQFKELINSCENGNSEMKITCEDLHGYWDTAYIQVENVNKRFDNITNMRANNWKEIIPEKKRVTKKTVVTKPKAQASSSLKEAIKAARNKVKTNQVGDAKDVKSDVQTFDGGFLSDQSPQKAPKALTPNSRSRTPAKQRKSLLIEVLAKESRKRGSSPGLAMLRVSQLAKSIEKSCESTETPAKSILKTKKSKSSVKPSKSVLFEENNVNSDNVLAEELITFTPEADTRRRSSRVRLTRSKLF